MNTRQLYDKANADKIKEQARQWRLKNKDKLREKRKKWNEENPEMRKKHDKDCYERNKEERLEKCAKHYLDNKEEILISQKAYNLEHKEDQIKRDHERWLDNKEEISKRNKKYYDEHREEQIAQHKQYAKDNPDKIKAARNTPKAKFASYKQGAKTRGHSFELTLADHFTPGASNTYWQKDCTYCGDKIATIGLDRIDNDKGYTVDNVVPCCGDCNWTRNNIWTYEEMKTIIGPALAKVKALRAVS